MDRQEHAISFAVVVRVACTSTCEIRTNRRGLYGWDVIPHPGNTESENPTPIYILDLTSRRRACCMLSSVMARVSVKPSMAIKKR